MALGDAALRRVRAEVTFTATDAVETLEVTVAPAGVDERAVAVLLIEPLSMSACPTVYVAVHCVLAPGARVPGGQEITNGGVAGAASTSVIPTLLRLTLPVLVTRNW